MELSTDWEGKSLLVKLSGELTIYTVGELKAALSEAWASAEYVDIDLDGVTEVDTAGLQLMLLAIRCPGKTVRFINQPQIARRLIDLTNLGNVLADSPRHAGQHS